MAEFRIFFNTTASTSVAVEADDFDTAVDLAWEEVPTNVCAHCSGWGGGPGIELAGEWDPDETVYVRDGEFIEVSK